MKYNLNDRLKIGPLLLYALQWWVVIIPSVITMGLVVGKLHFGGDAVAQGFYMQKLFFVLGVTLLFQVLAGHKLPLVVGPASVLLIGIIASASASMPAVYTAIMTGGLLLALISAFDLLKYIRRIFTPRVVIIIMLLIPLTLGPTIVKLIFNNNQSALFNLLFVLIFSVGLLAVNNILKGVWKSATLILGIAAATIAYRLFTPSAALSGVIGVLSSEPKNIFVGFEFDPGVILSFLCCAVALMINEVGSIEAVGQMLSADKMEGRMRRGVGITGLGSVLAGFFGVIGPIDYSSSPGIIASTRCASRFPFIPAALMLLVCAFIPQLVQELLTIPDAVMGTVLLYVMISQFAAGFQMTVNTKAVSDFNDGAGMGVSLMIALLISFMPSGLSEQIPSFIRPIVGNGFVMGIITILIMEHVVYRKKRS